MLWHTFLVRVNFDVFDKFKILLRHKYEINLCIRRTWLIGFEMTISFCKESVTNDKIICQRKNKDRQHFVTSWNLASIPVPVTTNITILFYLVNQKSQIKDYHLYFIELSRPVCGANTDKTVRISSQINGSIDTILSHVHFSCILSIKSSSRNTPTPFVVVVVSCLTQTFFTNGNRPINISVYLPFPQDYNVHQILLFQGYISLNLIQFLLKQKKKSQLQ